MSDGARARNEEVLRIEKHDFRHQAAYHLTFYLSLSKRAALDSSSTNRNVKHMTQSAIVVGAYFLARIMA